MQKRCRGGRGRFREENNRGPVSRALTRACCRPSQGAHSACCFPPHVLASAYYCSPSALTSACWRTIVTLCCKNASSASAASMPAGSTPPPPPLPPPSASSARMSEMSLAALARSRPPTEAAAAGESCARSYCTSLMRCTSWRSASIVACRLHSWRVLVRTLSYGPTISPGANRAHMCVNQCMVSWYASWTWYELRYAWHASMHGSTGRLVG